MDVTSLVVVWTLLGQAVADPFARPTAPAAATIAEPSRYDRYPPGGGARADYAVPAAGTGGGASITPPSMILPVAAAERSGAAAPAGSAIPGAPRGLSSPPAGYNGPTAGDGRGAVSSGATNGVTAPGSAFAPSQPFSTTELRNTLPATSIPAHQTPPATEPIAEDVSGAAKLVRESLILPKSLALPGKPITLLEAVGRSNDRRRQTAAVYAYWKLAGDLAEFHYAWQHQQFLKLLAEVLEGTEQGADGQHARTAVASRQAEAAAELREAELRLAATQAEFAAAAGITAEEGGLLTRDLPHAGVYNTSFDKVYARRTPPARAYLLQRTLPLRHDVVATRAQTVRAAQDAYEAAFDAYRKRQLALDDVLLSVAELRERRSQFMASVRRYNDEIAEYAFTSAPDGTSRETLVGMLIKSAYTPKLGKAVVPQDSQIVPVTYFEDGSLGTAGYGDSRIFSDSGVQGEIILDADPISGASHPATGNSVPPPRNSLDETSAGAPVPPYVEPPANVIPVYAPQPVPSTTASGASTVAYWESLPKQLSSIKKSGEPNLFDGDGAQLLAAPSAIPATFQRGTPTLAPPRERVEAPLKFKVNRVPVEGPDLLPAGADASALPPVGGRSPYSSAAHNAAPTTKTTAKTTAPAARTIEPKVLQAAPPAQTDVANAKSKPAVVDDLVTPAGFYNAVAGLPPAHRAQELVEFLYRSATAPDDTATAKITLDECLAANAGGDRRTMIAAYWDAAEAAATAQVWSQKIAQLEALSDVTLRYRETAVGAVAMLEVRAAKLAAESFLREARADLWAARWQLTDELRKPLGQPWLTAVTMPHAGGYRTQVASTAGSTTNDRVSRAAGDIAALHEILQLRREAVATADQSAEQALQKYAAGQTYVHTPLNEFRRQTQSTNQLLATVARYNREIADYALLMLPNGTPGDKLAGALVVDRTTTR